MVIVADIVAVTIAVITADDAQLIVNNSSSCSGNVAVNEIRLAVVIR